MHRPDALTLANTLDEAWHDQPRSFEREAAAFLTSRTPDRRLSHQGGDVILRLLRTEGEATP